MSKIAFRNAAIIAAYGILVAPTTPQMLSPLEDHSADPADLETWAGKWANANYSAKCGERSQLCVLDLDLRVSRSLLDIFEPTWRSRRDENSAHFWFRLPPNASLRFGSVCNGINSRAYVPVPGSKRLKTKNPYVWVPGYSPDEIELALLDDPWIARVREMSSPRRVDGIEVSENAPPEFNARKMWIAGSRFQFISSSDEEE